MDMDEMFYGKEMAEKSKLFQSELEVINNKHEDFFKERKSHLSSQEHDTLFNHCVTHIASGTIRFFFIDQEIPEYIMKECNDAFNRIFPGANFIPPR